MKRLIKTFSVILAVVIFALMAMGSGSSGSESTSSSGSISGGSGNQGSNSSKSLPTIEEQVLLDQDGFKITAVDYEKDSIWGEGIKLLLENNTSNDAVFTCNALIVNDFMINDLFYSTVAAGKKSNEMLTLYSNELNNAGIDTIGKIEVDFRIYDADSYSDIIPSQYVTVQTSDFGNMDTTPDDTGNEIYNDGTVRIVGKYVNEDSFWGQAILLYIENNGDSKVAITCDDMSINGFMVTPYFYTTVYGGKRSIDEITIMQSDLEDNGIESINEVEVKFSFYNPDTYETMGETDPITFSVN